MTLAEHTKDKLNKDDSTFADKARSYVDKIDKSSKGKCISNDSENLCVESVVDEVTVFLVRALI
jgi:hypothetical protein